MQLIKNWVKDFLIIIFLVALGVFTFTTHVYATRFANQFIEFELPVKWECALEGAEWVCQSTDEHQKRNALIVLAAKLKGPQDSLEEYTKYLNKPRSFNSPSGKALTSEPKYTKTVDINGHEWVDSLHLQSEIPDFYTRYLATVKNDIGVLVTYSIHREKYQEYLPQFESLTKSLKVFRKSNVILADNDKPLLPPSIPTNVLEPVASSLQPDSGKVETASNQNKAKKEDDNLLLLVLLGGGVLGFIIWKKRRA